MKYYKLIKSDSNLWTDIKEIKNYKDLFFSLTYRDFKVRYAQTSIGFLWAILQPIATLLILTLVFGKFIGVDTDIPHILFTITGTSLWSYFSFVIINAGNSIIQNQNMVKKIYFPRVILPISKSIVGLIDLFISLIILAVIMIILETPLSKNFLFSIIFILFSIICSLSIGILVCSFSVKYRDLQHVIPFVTQIGLYLTPIAYPAEFALKNLPSWAQNIYYLNPMTGIIEGFRWSIFGTTPPNNMIYISFFVVLVLFLTSVYYFNKVNGKIADYI